jgi:hypothetical protein
MTSDLADPTRWLRGEMYHIGIVVDDLHEGMKRYSALVGDDWSEVAGGPQPVKVDGVAGSLDFGFCFSRQGPVRIELVRAMPGTIWTAGAGVHHLGFWSDDVAGESARLTAQGCGLLVAIHVDIDQPPMATYHQGFGNVYIELVSTEVREFLEAMWS